jgi:flagellar motor protein MotB
MTNLLKTLIISFSSIFIAPILRGQNQQDLGRNEPFMVGLKGTIYKFSLPKTTFSPMSVGYTPEFEKTTPIGYVYTQSLNITERELTMRFPGVPAGVSTFAIIYQGIFEADSTEYTFVLKSDDGSRLWIDSTEVVNCDGIHQFNEPCKGKISLTKGFHSIKVWYFQGFPTRMGLVLLMKKRDDKQFVPFDLKPYEAEVEKIVNNTKDATNLQAKIENTVLFETGKAVLKPESETWLMPLTRLLVFNPNAKVRVEGHTDDVGTNQNNLKLSQQRADAVVLALQKLGTPPTVIFEAKGFGEEKPIAPNKTEEGRA